jgi:hypothetical protein
MAGKVYIVISSVDGNEEIELVTTSEEKAQNRHDELYKEYGDELADGEDIADENIIEVEGKRYHKIDQMDAQVVRIEEHDVVD